MAQGPEALRNLAAKYAALANIAEDPEEQRKFIRYAALYHDMATEAEELRRDEKLLRGGS